MIFLASILPHSSLTSHDACYLNHKSSVSPGNGKQRWSRFKYGEIRLHWTQNEETHNDTDIKNGCWHMCTRTHTRQQTHIHNGTMKSPCKIHPSLDAPQHTLIPSLYPSQHPHPTVHLSNTKGITQVQKYGGISLLMQFSRPGFT